MGDREQWRFRTCAQKCTHYTNSPKMYPIYSVAIHRINHASAPQERQPIKMPVRNAIINRYIYRMRLIYEMFHYSNVAASIRRRRKFCAPSYNKWMLGICHMGRRKAGGWRTPAAPNYRVCQVRTHLVIKLAS